MIAAAILALVHLQLCVHTDIEDIVPEERAAVRALKPLEARFGFHPSGHVKSVDLRGFTVKIGDQALEDLKSFSKLHSLALLHCDISDAGVQRVCELRQLRSLYLYELPVSDE